MTSSIDRIENLLKVIDEYESIFKNIRHHISNAKKSSQLEKKALSLVYMIDEAMLSPEAVEILTVERALFRINAPKARYRQRMRVKKMQKLTLESLGVNGENGTESQELDDYNPNDDF